MDKDEPTVEDYDPDFDSRFFSNDEMICPWCGWEYENSHEYDQSGSGEEVRCDECGDVFEMFAEISITYSTYRVEE